MAKTILSSAESVNDRSPRDGAGQNSVTEGLLAFKSSGTSGALIGYARVSTGNASSLGGQSADDGVQSTARQITELRAAGCVRVYEDVMSGSKTDRPGLKQAMDMLMEDDTLVVTEISRIGRSLVGALRVLEELSARGVGIKILGLGLDSRTPTGAFTAHCLLACAQLELSLNRERTLSGLAEARRQGRVGGRPKALDPERLQHVRQMHASGSTIKELAALMLVSERTIRRAVKDGGEQ
jgi:DNA invertase Pin-like site-specific DNA recombinase